MMKKTRLILVCGLLVLGLFSISPTVWPTLWFVDILANFKVQLTLILLLLGLLNFLKLKSRSITLITLILIGYNTSFFYHFITFNKPKSITSTKGASILSINLLKSNTKSYKVIDLIESEQPDILVLLEYNPYWERALKDLNLEYPHRITEVRIDNFGIAYFSKIPGHTSIVRDRITGFPSVLSHHVIVSDTLSIFATHPLPPLGQQRFELRNRHFSTIVDTCRRYNKHLIVLGDLNCSSFSVHFQKLKKALNLKDSRSGFGIQNTWHSKVPLLKTTLDHFLVSESIEVVDRSVGPNIGSDHLPIYMKFNLNN